MAVVAAELVILRVLCKYIACCVQGAVPLPTVNEKKVCLIYPCDISRVALCCSASKQKAHSSCIPEPSASQCRATKQVKIYEVVAPV